MAVGVEPTSRVEVPAFRVEVEEGPCGPLLRASGELDVLAAPTLEAALRFAERDPRGDGTGPAPGRRVEVDLAGVVFADCSGTRPIRRAALRLAEAGGGLVLRHARREVALVLGHQGLGPGGAAPRPRVSPRADGRPVPPSVA